MAKFISKQWLVYLFCTICVFFYALITYVQNNSGQSYVEYIGASIFGSIFFGIIVYMFSIPFQLTIWAFNKNPKVKEYIKWAIRSMIDSTRPKNNPFNHHHSSLN